MATPLVRAPECESFFSRLAKAPARILLLEYDGTLAPFRAQRDRALPYPGVPELLGTIVASGARVIVVSGRALSELVPLLHMAHRPEIWGTYGMERMQADGSYEPHPVSNEAVDALASTNAALLAAGLEDVLEVKPGAIAVHWRALSASLIRDIRSRVLTVWWSYNVSRWLALDEFDGGLEFRVRLTSTCHAIRELLDNIDTRASVAYLGGATSRSEDVFLGLKGRGIGVLVREEFRSTPADLWLHPPEEVVGFLVHWLDSCGIRV